MSYHHTTFTDSRGGNWRAGDVIRLGDWPFADAVVLGFDDEGYASLARPYVYTSGAGTTGPMPLTGVENMTGVRIRPTDNRVTEGRVT